jgi:hypothetical protein
LGLGKVRVVNELGSSNGGGCSYCEGHEPHVGC